MKNIITLLLLLVSFCVNATTYYISPSGNDGTGTGAIGLPWKTLYKACTAVTSSGDIIHVNAGTYTETLQCSLAAGVNIEGDGVTSILKSALTADYTAMLLLHSASEQTNGNQHLSNLKFDGQLTTQWGVNITARNNVSIYNCTFVDFNDMGVIFNGGVLDNVNATTYATGNSFHDNIMTNNSRFASSWGRGNLNIGWQQGMLIYNNTITQTGRSSGNNGWPIKYFNDGYLRGLQIYNNTLTRSPGTGSDFDFCIELFYESGLNVYNNSFVNGSMDMNHQTKGTYAYGAWIHNNTFTMSAINPSANQTGVTTEFESNDVIIEDNVMDKVGMGVYFTPRSGDTVQRIVIRRNLIKNAGPGMFTGSSAFINMGENSLAYFDSIKIYNNSFHNNHTTPYQFGINLPKNQTSGFIKNIDIKNNDIDSCSTAFLAQEGSSVLPVNLHIENNNRYGNGNSNNPLWISQSAPSTGYTFLNNISSNATYGANYILTAGSPLIDNGTNVGLSYNGTAPDIGYAEYGTATPPAANAGVDKTAILPTVSVSLTGSGTAYGGATITGYLWAKASGPSGTSFSASTSATTNLNFTTAGTYDITLTVTDSNGNTGYDEATITVSAAVTRVRWKAYLFRRR